MRISSFFWTIANTWNSDNKIIFRLFQVLIVQAAAHTQYLGEIELTFDDDGQLLKWTGNPHYIGNEIEQGMVCLKVQEVQLLYFLNFF